MILCFMLQQIRAKVNLTLAPHTSFPKSIDGIINWAKSFRCFSSHDNKEAEEKR